jgi:hypothetical protein
MAKYDDMSFGKAFAAARKEMGAGETFTWKGKSYTTNYKEEVASDKPMRPKARPEPMRPKARPSTTGGGGADKMPASKDKPRGRGDGAAEVARRSEDSKPKSYNSSGRGFGAGEMARRRTDARKAEEAKAEAARKAKEDMQDRAKAVAVGGAALGAAVLGGRAILKGAPKAPTTTAAATTTSKPANPAKTGGPRLSQNKTGGPRVGQTKTVKPTITRGAGGGVRVVGSTKFKSGGGKQAQMIDKALNPFNFSKGGMVKKGKK